MANAVLFKRDYTRPKVTGNGHNAVAVGSLPATHKIEFNTTTQITEANTMSFTNQIVAKPSPTNDGTRLIKIQDNGASDISFQVRGMLKVDSNDANIIKLINFAKEVQVEVSCRRKVGSNSALRGRVCTVLAVLAQRGEFLWGFANRGQVRRLFGSP